MRRGVQALFGWRAARARPPPVGRDQTRLTAGALARGQTRLTAGALARGQKEGGHAVMPGVARRVLSEPVVSAERRPVYYLLGRLWLLASCLFSTRWLRGEHVDAPWFYALFSVALWYDGSLLPIVYFAYVGWTAGRPTRLAGRRLQLRSLRRRGAVTAAAVGPRAGSVARLRAGARDQVAVSGECGLGREVGVQQAVVVVERAGVAVAVPEVEPAQVCDVQPRAAVDRRPHEVGQPAGLLLLVEHRRTHLEDLERQTAQLRRAVDAGARGGEHAEHVVVGPPAARPPRAGVSGHADELHRP